MLISNAAKPLRFVLGVFFIYSRTVGVGCLFIFWMLPFDAQVFNVVAVPIPLFFLALFISLVSDLRITAKSKSSDFLFINFRYVCGFVHVCTQVPVETRSIRSHWL